MQCSQTDAGASWQYVASCGKHHWYRLETETEIFYSCARPEYRMHTPFKTTKENDVIYQTKKMSGEEYIELRLRSWDTRVKGLYTVFVDKRYWDAVGHELHWCICDNYVCTGPVYSCKRMHTEVRKYHGWTPQRGITTDHRNTNSLDNRLSNLRDATPLQQAANRGKKRHRSGQAPASEYSGVYRKGNRWEGRVRRSNASAEEQAANRGVFDSEEEAAEFVNQRRRLLDGEFDRLNMISGSSDSGSSSGGSE